VKYDVIIPAGKKDVHRVPFCVASLKYLNPQPENVFIVTPDPSLVSLPVNVLADADVFKFTKKGNWVFQQFVKLFQPFTPNDLYLSVDADLIFAQPFNVFDEGGKLVFFRYKFAGNADSVFKFIEVSLGIPRVIPHVMMSHFMMFNRPVCRELMERFIEVHPLVPGKTPEEHFYDWVLANQSGDISMSEFELYSNFVATRHPEMYEIRVTEAWDVPYYDKVTGEFVEAMKKELETKYKPVPVITVHSRLGEDSF
jgi:hypothetical protein